MKDRTFYLSRISFISLMAVLILAVVSNTQQQAWAQEAIMMIQPAENQMVIAKKPMIECQIQVPWDKQSLYIELDWNDMTGLADITDSGFSFKPAQVMDPGEHTLSITFMDDQGNEIIKEFAFSTRQTKMFEQAYSKNNITAVYTDVVKKMNDAKDQGISDYKVEGNLFTQNMIAEGPWMFSLESNVQYFDQELAAADPLEKGAEFADYIFTGQYEKGNLLVVTNIGDIYVDESRNTISGLSRRGGKAKVDYGPVYVGGFVVRSDQVFGIDGDAGMDLDNTDHIYGASAGIRLFSDRMDVKAIYATGGESASDTSYGIWPEPGGLEGEVHGFQMTSNFFENKLETFLEWDQSDYDADVSDSTGSVKDKAWLASANGQISMFDYGVEYEYTGPDYMVPGNSIQQDWEGYTVRSGLSLETQRIDAHVSSYEDNVEDNPANQTLESNEYGIDYTYSGFKTWPISLGWLQSTQDSSGEPAGTDPTHTVTNSYRAGIAYEKDQWNISLDGDYSLDDDQTADDYDTSSRGIKFTPGYTGERVTLTPSFSFNRTTYYSDETKTDTLETSLSFWISVFEGFSVEGYGSYTRTYDNQDTTNEDTYYADLKLGYEFTSPIKGILTPSFMLQLIHNSSGDNIADTNAKDTVIYFYLTAALDLSF